MEFELKLSIDCIVVNPEKHKQEKHPINSTNMFLRKKLQLLKSEISPSQMQFVHNRNYMHKREVKLQ